jgi:hypothetical protein
MWRLRYSLESAGYIADNWHLIDDLIAAIKALAETDDAIPPEGVQRDLGLYVWEIAHHRVYYAPIPEKNNINILVLKPLG